MGRYYFHVRNESGLLSDEEGRDLADLNHARRVAIKGARSLICAEVEAGALDLRGCIEIADAAGAVLMVVAFTEAVQVRH